MNTLTPREPDDPGEILAGFAAALLEDATEAGFAAAVAAHPRVFDAALAWLRGRYVEGRGPRSAFECSEAFRIVLEIALTQMDDRGRERFLQETLFHVSHPDACRELAPLVRTAIGPDELGERMLHRARTGTTAQRRHLAELEYHVFGAHESYELRGSLRVALEAALHEPRPDTGRD